MEKFKPFFLNSNLALGKKNYSSVEDFLRPVAGNTGNSYITYALAKAVGADFADFSHIENIYEYDFANADKDCDFVKNTCTHVFLILQDQIRIAESYNLKLPYKNIVSFLKKCGKQVVVAGLGANAFGAYDSQFHKKLDPQLVDFLHAISELTPQIGIRGNFTAEVLANLGIRNTRVIGCPSFFETGAKRILKNPDSDSLKPVLTSPLALPQNSTIPTVLQDFQERELLETILFGKLEIEMPRTHYRRIARKNVRVFYNPQEWKTFLSGFNFAVGPRIHGSIAAINAGVPAVCTNTDARASEMCEFLKIPHASIRPNFAKKRQIADAENEFLRKALCACDTDTLNAAYPKLFENYKSFIKSQGLPFELESNAAKAAPDFAQFAPYANLGTRKLLQFAAKRFIHKKLHSIAKRIPFLRTK